MTVPIYKVAHKLNKMGWRLVILDISRKEIKKMLSQYQQYLECEIDSEDFASELEGLYPGITLREILEDFYCPVRTLDQLVSDRMTREEVILALRIVLGVD